jgi:hypothetical protein
LNICRINRPNDTSVSHDRRDELRGRNIERRIVDGGARRRSRQAEGIGYFLGRALLNGNLRAGGDR